ncbi:MAG: methyl-accepting chemotaxis protein [Xanthobacteraceae bacterium]
MRHDLLDRPIDRNAPQTKHLPAVEAPPSEPEAEPAAGARLDVIRETIDLLEADLSAMIRGVEGAAGAVHDGTKASAEALEAIRRRSEALAKQSSNAKHDASQLAAATEELANSSTEISRQVDHARSLTGQVHQVASAAGGSLDGLKRSSGEIGDVVNLIASIAKQTNLLALNAKIEAARAGAAGRGFAVVADEVKALSVETQKATNAIAQRIGQLQHDAAELISAVNGIVQMIETMQPVFGAVASAAVQQNATSSELARNAAASSQFVTTVADDAAEIERAAAAASGQSDVVDHSSKTMVQIASELKTRFIIFLRQTEIGNRRRHDRLPCEIGVTLRHPGGTAQGVTVDLSEGGMLATFPGMGTFPVGTMLEATVAGIGPAHVRVANCSSQGLHFEFNDLGEATRDALDAKLTAIRAENHEWVERAVKVAETISNTFEELVSSGRITFDALFDNNYVPIEGTSPQQYRTAFLDVIERVLPPIQNPVQEANSRMTLCAAIDRNGYIPVHRPKHSQPQRPDDAEWNGRNCRNRRIYDDPMRLAAARSTRAYMIQQFSHEREGKMLAIRSVAAPIRVFGKHWGALRTTYRI